jgi:hypothetical protein
LLDDGSGARSGSLLETNGYGFGSGKAKTKGILWIRMRIHNTASKNTKKIINAPTIKLAVKKVIAFLIFFFLPGFFVNRP